MVLTGASDEIRSLYPNGDNGHKQIVCCSTNQSAGPLRPNQLDRRRLGAASAGEKWYNDAMDAKKTAAQRLVELLRMTLAELRERRAISTGRSVFNDDIGTLKLPLPDKIREEIIEAELESGTISK